jgi:CrcB protein
VEKAILVGLGGFAGTLARYLLGGWIARSKGAATFPYETLAVNVTGCLVIGLLAGLSETRGIFSSTTRAVLFIGVLGGFTTFSTFGYETVQLLRGGQAVAATWNIGSQLVLGLGAVWGGRVLARLIGGA